MATIKSVEFYVVLLLVIGNATHSQIVKIEPTLRQIYQREPSSKLNIFVEMREGNANTLQRVNSLRFSSRTEKTNAMKTQLESLADTSQKRILSILEEEEADFISFWINNRVFVRDASWALVQSLEKEEEVSLIRQEEIYHLPEVVTTSSNTSIKAIWSVENIEAPQAWGMKGGNKGEGVVIAIIDSGVRRTHVDLRNNFREDYGWLDPINGDQVPSDEIGSGTILTGSAVGADGIGVALGAEWIACRACDAAVSCSESALVSCGQWIACPTRPNGEDPDCSKAPHISSNAWGGESAQGYLDVVNAWHSAGIIPIFSIGAGGPGCGTTMSPGNFENVIGVGATDMSDTIYYGSGRGPAGGRLKPDICAPGVGIWSASCLGDNDYAFTAGTGFASPHVAGAVAILLARNSSLSFEQVKNILQKNTDMDLGDAEMCGGTLPSYFPNNIYGYGRLNVRKALEGIANDQNDTDSSAPNHQSEFKISTIISLVVLIYLSLNVKD